MMGHTLCAGPRGAMVSDHAVPHGIQAGIEFRAERGAHGGCAIRSAERQPFVSEAIDVRCLHVLAT